MEWEIKHPSPTAYFFGFWERLQMTAYRHINLLVDLTTYLNLRDLSRKTGRPYSEIVREAIWNTIENAKKDKSR